VAVTFGTTPIASSSRALQSIWKDELGAFVRTASISCLGRPASAMALAMASTL
jgi:hypothetical protein